MQGVGEGLQSGVERLISESKWIQRLISEKPVLVLSRSGCCMSYTMKTLFYGLGANPTVIELDTCPGLPSSANKVIAPVVFIAGSCVGGPNNIMALQVKGLLVKKLIEAGAISFEFRAPDEQKISTPDPKSREKEDSEHLQVQVDHYSKATITISDHRSTSGTASERGVLCMEELARLNEIGEVVTQGQKLSPEDKGSLARVNEIGEVVTQGQKLSPEDKDSLTKLTDELSHSHEKEVLEEILLVAKELEGTPSNPRELEELNSDPMDVTPTISHHFTILHVLDLSYTEINSLPQSISRLVALRKLFLRGCELLMELPPEIGDLVNLEVLDLEGTEILCLPKEIAKLVNLTCLKVSFHGYANQANQTVIPRRVLSNLSSLIELIIDVTPYGGWWDVEVEVIIDDLCTLKELRTLKLYLPTAELLVDLTLIFLGLENFRFTVGRYEEHFISRLPQDVEEEFNNWEKLKKGLKYCLYPFLAPRIGLAVIGHLINS